MWAQKAGANRSSVGSVRGPLWITNGPRGHARRTSVDPPIPDEIAAGRKSAVPPRHSYDPVRLPPWPSPCATLRPLPSPVTGLPRLPEPPFRRAVPTTPADRAGARVDYFPAHNAFPKWQEGQHPHCHFRGLRRLHSRYGPPDRSATQGDLCHEAPAQPVTQPSRSSATGPIRQLSGWNPPPQMLRALGAHCQERKCTRRPSLPVVRYLD